MPRAYAACGLVQPTPELPLSDLGITGQVIGTRAGRSPQGASKGLPSVPGRTSAGGSPKLRFHRVALEVDDHEIVLIFTEKFFEVTNDSYDLGFPPWLKSTRIVVPHSSVTASQHWIAGDEFWPLESEGFPSKLFRYWSQVTCTPGSAPHPITVLIALPNIILAQRFRDALCEHRTSRAATTRLGNGLSRTGIRCELQLLVSMDPSCKGQAEGCASLIQREICEALGVGPHRVRVLSVMASGGTLLDWASLQLAKLQNSWGLAASEAPQRRFYLDV